MANRRIHTASHATDDIPVTLLRTSFIFNNETRINVRYAERESLSGKRSTVLGHKLSQANPIEQLVIPNSGKENNCGPQYFLHALPPPPAVVDIVFKLNRVSSSLLVKAKQSRFYRGHSLTQHWVGVAEQKKYVSPRGSPNIGQTREVLDQHKSKAHKDKEQESASLQSRGSRNVTGCV